MGQFNLITTSQPCAGTEHNFSMPVMTYTDNVLFASKTVGYMCSKCGCVSLYNITKELLAKAADGHHMVETVRTA